MFLEFVSSGDWMRIWIWEEFLKMRYFNIRKC